MSRITRDKLRRAQALLSHRLPSGDLAEVLDLALDALIQQLERRKLGATDRPRSSTPRSMSNSRHIPAHVKRAVRKRDGDRCAYVSPDGKRCVETSFLEFHHVEEFARGGSASVENIEQLCHAHNQHAAEQTYGAGFIRQKRERACTPQRGGSGSGSASSRWVSAQDSAKGVAIQEA